MFWAKRKLHSKPQFSFFKSRYFIYSFTAIFYLSAYNIVQRQLHWCNGVVGISQASFALMVNVCRATVAANTDWR